MSLPVVLLVMFIIFKGLLCHKYAKYVNKPLDAKIQDQQGAELYIDDSGVLVAINLAALSGLSMILERSGLMG